MGSVHDFKRPPKNERQFKGYRPEPSNGRRDGEPFRRQRRNWQKTVLAWSALVLFAAGIWLIAEFFAA
jgi:hypothetical protein